MVWKILRPSLWTIFNALSRISLRRGDYRCIFILGHMRAGSTLLAHVLANHTECAGAGETHLSYQMPSDLPNLALKTCQMLHNPLLRRRYFVDQINHPYVSDDVLLSTRIYKCIILLREPGSTLKSMMSLSIWSEKEAVEIYVKRLKQLLHYGIILGGRAILVEYEDLVDRTQQTLDRLTDFLGFDPPLTPNYTTHRMTGRIPGFGDPSDNIKTGHIIRTPSHSITISKEALDRATLAYGDYREQIRAATVRSELSGSSSEGGDIILLKERRASDRQ